MSNKKVSGDLFKKMVTNGAINLKNNHKEIDHLNVFPVPDGDTGTNMQMTMMAGVKEFNSTASESIVDVSKILSRGLLMGARGNSGVILSQFFRGVYSELSKIDNGSVDTKEFIQSLVGGYQMAYRAVMDPVEGTILTVVRESAEKVLKEQANLKSIEDVLRVYLEQAKETLIKTPELLPVLKEAGVVDSGGAGFVKIVEGMLMALEGTMLTAEDIVTNIMQPQFDYEGAHALGDVDIKYGYCTEFIVELFNKDEFELDQVRIPLSQMGDSLVAVTDEELLKIHVHTNQPGVALTLGQKYGELKTVKIENMRSQHSSIMGVEHANAKEPVSKYAIIAVASGEGIQNTLKELGVNHIIDGGQTMNPSTEDFVKAVKSLNAENVIILPNNSNIILAAEQTLDLCPENNIRVLKTKSVAQGYASLMAFDPTVELDENVDAMMDVSMSMKYGEVTYAVRDTEMNGVKINVSDYIGISKGKIIVADKSRTTSVMTLINDMIDENSEIVTIFYGQDVDKSEIEKITSEIADKNPDIDIETVDGKQDIYSYIIAVE